MKGYICTITGKVYIGKTTDINRRMVQHSHIVSCCKGRRKTAYGFVWKYEEKEVTHG
jgi:predicted GIY-YIG superfamily endonuclease